MDKLEILLKFVKSGSFGDVAEKGVNSTTTADFATNGTGIQAVNDAVGQASSSAPTGDITFIIIAVLLCAALASLFLLRKKIKKKISIPLGVVLIAGLLCFSTSAVAFAQNNNSVQSNFNRIHTSNLVGQVDDKGNVFFNQTEIKNLQNWGVNFSSIKVKELENTNGANWKLSLNSTGAKLYDDVAGKTQTSKAAMQAKTQDSICVESNIAPDLALKLVDKDILKITFDCKEIQETKFISHAGVHLTQSIAGQNSLQSMRLAKRAGFDFMEVDVRATKDGEIVAMHNPEVNNTMRQKNNYKQDPFPWTEVKNLTLKQLKENYVFKTDNPEYRVAAPTLKEFCEEANKIGMTLMIHPKISEHPFVDKVMQICDEAVGRGSYYVVSEEKAVDYILKEVDPNMNTMRVMKTKSGTKRYAEQYPNTILAVAHARSDYNDFAPYCKSLGRHVESTLNVHVQYPFLAADVVNYDYLSPCKSNQYQLIEKISGKMRYNYGSSDIEFGTAELTFKYKGKVHLRICKGDDGQGHVYDLNSKDWQEVRIPHFIYGSKYPAVYNIADPGNAGQVKDIEFKIWQH